MNTDTVDSIVDDFMRYVRKTPPLQNVSITTAYATKLSQRIKAANRREFAELRNGISELLDALQSIYDEECTSFGTGEVYDKWRNALKGWNDEGK